MLNADRARRGPDMNPNFPSGLDIKPSTAPGSALHLLFPGEADIDAPAIAVDRRFDAAAQEKAIRTYGIAGRVWEASYAMLAYLDPDRDRSLSGGGCIREYDPPPFTAVHDAGGSLTIVELGSGTGLIASRVGLLLRPNADRVVATDLPEVCPMLETNLRGMQAVSVCPLPWGSLAHAKRLATDHAFHLRAGASAAAGISAAITHIVCSDLIYFPELLAPFLRTLLHLTSPPFGGADCPPAQVVLSYKIRSLAKEQPFWAAFGLWFEFAPVLSRTRPCRGSDEASYGPWTRFVPVAGDEETFVFAAWRRTESLSWSVPEDDRELLEGFGAWGTWTGKADDAFETMLLMQIDADDV